MSYLFPLGDTATIGLLQVGSNISVDANSVISIPQNLASNANVTFGNITDSALTSGRITFAGTSGILSDSGNLIFNTTSNTLSVTNANVSGNLNLNGNSVITKITPSAGNGVSIGNLVSNGPNASFTVTNTGVLNLTAGTGINVSASTGNITISSTGTSIINTTGPIINYTITASDEFVGVGGITPTTVTLPAGITGTLYYIKNEKTNSSKVTVACTGIDTIDGANTKDLSQNASITVVFHNLVWRIV
jgi:hypothetical protein